jgi:putative transposase
MLISLAYRLTCKILGAVATLARRDVSSEAELLVLRHENTALRRRPPLSGHRPPLARWHGK